MQTKERAEDDGKCSDKHGLSSKVFKKKESMAPDWFSRSYARAV